jgi:hypothetical protein
LIHGKDIKVVVTLKQANGSGRVLATAVRGEDVIAVEHDERGVVV